MIDKKKFKNAINKSQKAMQNAPTDQSMTVDVKNEELEAQIKVYTKEKTRENLNQLIEIARKCRLLVPANLNEQDQPVPCLLNSQENGLFFPAYTSKEQIPQEPKSPAIINMPYLAINEVACRQAEHIGGIVINPFTDNLVFKMPLVQRIEEVEKARKNAGKVKTMQLTPEQYVLFERKQFEFGFLPRRLFENGKEMMEQLCEKKEEYIDQLFEESYQQKRMYPYLPEDFSVMVLNISDDLTIARVDLPNREMGVPSCYRIYLAWDEKEQKGRYMTIEKTKDAGSNLLGEMGSDWKHVDYGLWLLFDAFYCARIGAKVARTTFARSCGLSAIVVPMRPPLIYILSNCSADASITVGNAFFIPSGLQPPRTYPVIAVRSLTWIISTDFSPTERAAAFKSTSSAIGMTKT